MCLMKNMFYFVFLKFDCLKMFIVGVGEVGCEKLIFLFKSSLDVYIIVVAWEVLFFVLELLEYYLDVDFNIIWKDFELVDIEGFDLVIVVMNFEDLNW